MNPADRRGVRRTYDRIAGHFAETRHHAWPEVEAFLDGRTGRVGLDIGCGNGRHAEFLVAQVDRTVALDLSRPLLVEAADRVTGVALLQGDAADLPLAADTVDLAVYVATIHHLPTGELRVRSLDELARVLAPGGRALVSAWSTVHDRFDADAGFDTELDWTLPGGETVPRYYHIYDPEEFRADLEASDLHVLETYVSSGNCYAVAGVEG